MFLSLLCTVGVIVAAASAAKGFSNKPSEKSPEREEYITDNETYSELSERIETLNGYKEEIDNINEMIADIMSCAPGKVHKTAAIKIIESGREYQMLLTGEDFSSELILEILQGEREELSSSLRKEIKKIT